MKKFLIGILFIIIAFFAIDRFGGIAMEWVNQHTHDDIAPKMKHLFSDVKEEVLFMGTSRSNCHYVPSIISDSLGKSVYNGGIDASNNIYAHYLVLNHVLNVHKPKLICLEVLDNDYEKRENPFETITFFAPYFGHNEAADSLFHLAGTYWKYKFSHLYRYNAKSVSNVAGLMASVGKETPDGYLPCPRPQHHPAVLAHKRTSTEVDSLKLAHVQKFIDLCHQNEIKLVFTVSPMYIKVDTCHYDILKAIANRNGIPFLDYHTNGMFQDSPEFFYDATHLCDEGARAYSVFFVRDLKRVLEGCEL